MQDFNLASTAVPTLTPLCLTLWLLERHPHATFVVLTPWAFVVDNSSWAVAWITTVSVLHLAGFRWLTRAGGLCLPLLSSAALASFTSGVTLLSRSTVTVSQANSCDASVTAGVTFLPNCALVVIKAL